MRARTCADGARVLLLRGDGLRARELVCVWAHETTHACAPRGCHPTTHTWCSAAALALRLWRRTVACARVAAAGLAQRACTPAPPSPLRTSLSAVKSQRARWLLSPNFDIAIEERNGGEQWGSSTAHKRPEHCKSRGKKFTAAEAQQHSDALGGGGGSCLREHSQLPLPLRPSLPSHHRSAGSWQAVCSQMCEAPLARVGSARRRGGGGGGGRPPGGGGARGSRHVRAAGRPAVAAHLLLRKGGRGASPVLAARRRHPRATPAGVLAGAARLDPV